MVYITDLDGTLLNENGQLSEYTKQKLNELIKEQKITFFTARSYQVAKKILEGINWTLPCVVNNGAFIVDTNSDKILEANYIEKDIVISILKKAKEYKLPYILLCIYKGEEKMIYAKTDEFGTCEFIRQRQIKKDKRIMEMSSKIDLKDMNIFSMQFINTYENLKMLKEALQSPAIISYMDKEIYIKDYYYLNINSSKATKEKALVKVMEKLHEPLKDVTAFGDQINDLDIIKAAGTGIAVENANEELKLAADKIIGRNTEDSVVKYILSQNN